MRLVLAPDEALVVRAAAGDAEVALPERPGPLDWSRALAMAEWHRVVPMLWRHLRTTPDVAAVPEDVAAHLRTAAREAAVRALATQADLGRVLVELDAAGIPTMLLKGAALVEVVYEEPELRPMVDVDVLVPATDIGRAHDLIRSAGYEAGDLGFGRDDDRRLSRYHHHFPLARVGGGAVIELHQRPLADRPGYDLEGLWGRARPSPTGGPQLLPSPEDLFLHVAAHFSFDRVTREVAALRQLADLVRIADRWPLDWELVTGLAREYDLVDRIFLALASLDTLFRGVVPPAAVATLRPASYTDDLGALFVRQRVLSGRSSISLEHLLGGGAGRVLGGRDALEFYLRPDEQGGTSLARLRARRVTSLARRVARELPGPTTLWRDVRLSRWIVSLRR